MNKIFILKITMDDGKTWAPCYAQGFYTRQEQAEFRCKQANESLSEGELARVEVEMMLAGK
jgi:hypothetical protein